MKEKIIKDSLSKFCAQAGIASRRKVIDLIKQGLIKVDGIIIKDPAYKITSQQKITYKDKPIKKEERLYILLNKPKDYITTVSDEKGRNTVIDLVDHAIGVRLYPVGRLDRNTTGLLVLTNDGNLALRLSHPHYEVQKVYAVTLNRLVTERDMVLIKKGLQLDDGLIVVDSVSYIPRMPRNNVKVILHSGKNRIVRRIFEHLGFEVIKLDRVGYAGLTKKNLAVGQWRYLTAQEIEGFCNENAHKKHTTSRD
jgi:23S rRNA pseudouridine2605 synthase